MAIGFMRHANSHRAKKMGGPPIDRGVSLEEAEKFPVVRMDRYMQVRILDVWLIKVSWAWILHLSSLTVDIGKYCGCSE